MKRSLRATLCAGLAAAMPVLAAGELECAADAPLSSPLRLEYGVTASRWMISLSGNGAIVYQRKGDAYTLESSLKALGIFEAHQSSAGTVSAAGLVPRTFTQRSNRRPTQSVDFDWTARRVTFSPAGQSAPTQPQMQDRLSVLMQLAWRHHAEPGAGTIELPVAGHRSASNFVFNAQGRETLTLPVGRIEAVKFEQQKQERDDTLDVWLAPSLCSLPVRVRFADDRGVVIEQQLRAVHPL